MDAADQTRRHARPGELRKGHRRLRSRRSSSAPRRSISGWPTCSAGNGDSSTAISGPAQDRRAALRRQGRLQRLPRHAALLGRSNSTTSASVRRARASRRSADCPAGGVCDCAPDDHRHLGGPKNCLPSGRARRHPEAQGERLSPRLDVERRARGRSQRRAVGQLRGRRPEDDSRGRLSNAEPARRRPHGAVHARRLDRDAGGRRVALQPRGRRDRTRPARRPLRSGRSISPPTSRRRSSPSSSRSSPRLRPRTCWRRPRCRSSSAAGSDRGARAVGPGAILGVQGVVGN